MNPKNQNANSELGFLITSTKAVLLEKDIKTLLHTLELNTLHEKKLISLAHKHAVLPLLYKTLKNIAPKHTLTTLLKPYYMGVVKKNMSMSAQLISLVERLKDSDIRTLSFKGPVLSQLAYGDITLRQYGDLDILIQKKDRKHIISLMKKDGYIPEITLSNAKQTSFLQAVNVLGFLTPTKETFIEVHWELLSKNYAITWHEKELWNNSSSININNQALLTLNPMHTLLYLCTHGSKHLYERLSWVCDVDRVVRSQKDLDWVHTINTAKDMGIYRMLLLSLALCQSLLDLPLPKELEDIIAQDKKVQTLSQKIIILHFTQQIKTTKSYSTFKLLCDMRENKQAKLRFCYLALFHPKFDDFKSIQLPFFLSFLYPFIRPFRLLGKYFK